MPASYNNDVQSDSQKPMNPKQERFVLEYLKDLNATEAAKRAGYAKSCAEVTGHRLLRNKEVAAAVAEAKKRRAKRTEIDQDRVLLELGRIGLSDLRGAFDENGRLKRPEEWSDDVAAAISAVEVVTKNLGEGEVEYVSKIKLWDKNSALEKIGKHIGMFIERHQHTGKDGGPIETKDTSPLAVARAVAALLMEGANEAEQGAGQEQKDG